MATFFANNIGILELSARAALYPRNCFGYLYLLIMLTK